MKSLNAIVIFFFFCKFMFSKTTVVDQMCTKCPRWTLTGGRVKHETDIIVLASCEHSALLPKKPVYTIFKRKLF